MKKSGLFIFFFLLSIPFVKATHNRAGEILYKRIAPYSASVGSGTVPVYHYSITVIKYTDNGAAIADRCVDTVYFGDGSKGIAPRVNGATGCCGNYNGQAIACGEIILSLPGYTVKRSVFTTTHTYSAQGSYVVSSRDPYRNAGVLNIPNSDSQLFCISSLIIVGPATGSNQSPNLNYPPVDQASVDACFLHNPSAYDNDGDSLSFELIPCECAMGYTDPPHGPAGSFSIHPITGLLVWCDPQQLGEYNLAIRINEWRKNTNGLYQKIGHVIRDMQVLVTNVYTGLSQTDSAPAFEIQPNPCQDRVQIIAASERGFDRLNLVDVSGKVVCTAFLADLPEKNSFDMTRFQPGVYFLELLGSKGRQVKKLVKN